MLSLSYSIHCDQVQTVHSENWKKSFDDFYQLLGQPIATFPNWGVGNTDAERRALKKREQSKIKKTIGTLKLYSLLCFYYHTIILLHLARLGIDFPLCGPRTKMSLATLL